MKNLAKDAASLTAAKIITTLISLVSSMLLARFRTLEEYGTYSEILVVVSLATAIFTLGLPSSINYFLARAESEEERSRFLSIYYTLSTLLCFVMGIVLACATPIIVSYFNNSLIRNFTFVLVLLPWTKVIIGSISNVLIVYGKTALLAKVNIVNAAIALLSIFITNLFDWSFSEYMFLFVAGEMLVMLWVYVIIWRIEGSLKPKIEIYFFKQILQYAIPIGLATVVGTISTEVDKLMIGYFLEAEAIAIYANAGRELPLTMFSSSLTAVVLPQMARKLKLAEIDGAVSLWGKSLELGYIIIAFFVTVCVVFAPQIITFLYSEKYLLGTQVFRVYSLVLLLRVTYFGMVLSSVGKTKFIFYCSLFSLCINVFLNYLLFSLLGFIGPAIATFLTVLITNVAQLVVTCKVISVSFMNVFPWKKLLDCTGINLIWGAIVWSFVKQIDLGTDFLSIVRCICIGLAAMVVYVLAERKRVIHLWRELNCD